MFLLYEVLSVKTDETFEKNTGKINSNNKPERKNPLPRKILNWQTPEDFFKTSPLLLAFNTFFGKKKIFLKKGLTRGK